MTVNHVRLKEEQVTSWWKGSGQVRFAEPTEDRPLPLPLLTWEEGWASSSAQSTLTIQKETDENGAEKANGHNN